MVAGAGWIGVGAAPAAGAVVLVTVFGCVPGLILSLWPLLSMALGATLFSVDVVLQRVQNELLLRERGNAWVRDAIA